MDQRIIQYYAGKLSDDEKKELLQEAFANPSLKQEMMECKHIQTLMSVYPEESDTATGHRSWMHFLQKQQQKHYRKLYMQIMRYAAVLTVGILSTWLVLNYSADSQEIIAMEQQLTVPPGQRAHIVLPDGSKVWVNACSTLSYPSVFTQERRVKITGEAMFEVAKNNTPFIVSTGKMDVRALGTRFNVCNYPTDPLSIALLQGSVKVYPPQQESQSVLLKPGQEVKEEGEKWIIGAIDQGLEEWKEGIFTFNNQPLHDIFRKLELFYDVKITVKNPKIPNSVFTGKLRQQDGVIEILRILQKLYSFRVSRKADGKEITLY